MNLVRLPVNPDDTVQLAAGYDFRGLRTTEGWVVYWMWRIDEVKAKMGWMLRT